MSVPNKEALWIWYPGDFELYHAMKQNFSRVERGMGWPAFWKSEGFRNRVVFRRTYELDTETSFTVFSDAVGYVLVEEKRPHAGIVGERDDVLHVPETQWFDKKYPIGQRITCTSGHVRISVHAARIDAFPSIYIDGSEIYSDAGWMAEDYDHAPVPAGYCKYYIDPEQDPSVWEYTEKEYLPVSVEEIYGGVLCEFETELTAQIEVKFNEAVNRSEVCFWTANPGAKLLCGRTVNNPSMSEDPDLTERAGSVQMTRVCCGESRSEALDPVHCYYSWIPDADTGRCPRYAVRYAYIPGCSKDAVHVKAIHQYVDIPVKASFSCDDELLKFPLNF